MSNQLFEIAFSGQICDGADLNDVKAKVGKMFNADGAKLAQLFSGKRIVIKKNIDQATAKKYQVALKRVGAQCEVKVVGGNAATAGNAKQTKPAPGVANAAAAKSSPAKKAAATNKAPSKPKPAKSPAAKPSSGQYESSYDGEVAPPPQTDPLGISGDQIEELAATIAPVGSELQDAYEQSAEPNIDIASFAMAPVGSELSTAKKEPEPAPPDTSGISMAD